MAERTHLNPWKLESQLDFDETSIEIKAINQNTGEIHMVRLDCNAIAALESVGDSLEGHIICPRCGQYIGPCSDEEEG